jgi:hypothetical protein
VSLPGFIVLLGLVALGTARYSEPLDSGAWQDWTFFAALATSVVVFAAAAWQQAKGPLRSAVSVAKVL